MQLTAILRKEIRITKKIPKKQGKKYGERSLLNLFSRQAIIVKIQNGDKRYANKTFHQNSKGRACWAIIVLQTSIGACHFHPGVR
jgi:hypothetical protein